LAGIHRLRGVDHGHKTRHATELRKINLRCATP
jgi:hypothetical protein